MTLLTQTATPGAKVLNAAAVDVWANKNISINPVRVTSILGQSIVILPSASKVVNGFFKDQSGLGIARAGYAIDRATGAFITAFVSASGTGAFSFFAPTTNPVIVILIPNSGDGRNAVVLDNIVPI